VSTPRPLLGRGCVARLGLYRLGHCGIPIASLSDRRKKRERLLVERDGGGCRKSDDGRDGERKGEREMHDCLSGSLLWECRSDVRP
jgi:hypothetical protein